jgi:sialic acid synthase SpsE
MLKKTKISEKISIEGKEIGKGCPTYFIAEIGSNFDGDLDRAKELIFMAKEAGADAAKFQHYTANSLVSNSGFEKINSKHSHQSSWSKSVYKTYENASLEASWTEELKKTCEEAKITFLTSPYSFFLVDFVDQYVSAYKVGSGDITWIEIIKYMASKKKPIILATGASSMNDVHRAVDSILEITPDIVLLQCNTNYTASPENFSHLQLNVIPEFEKKYPGIITGLSDHMPGHVPVLGAVALGASVIEKHFTDSNNRPGPDHSFAMTPESWREMVDRVRELELSLGDNYKKIEENERNTAIVQRRSVCAAKSLSLGVEIKEQDLTVLRPCPSDGIPPFELNSLIGKKLKRDISHGEYIKREDLI